MKKVLYLSILLLLTGLPLELQAAQNEDNAGFAQIALPEMLIGQGTRLTAMGGAGVALTDDISSLYWNPAGIAHMQALTFELMHNTWLLDTYRESMVVSWPLSSGRSLALGVNYFGIGTIEQTKINNDGTIALTDELLTLFNLGVGAGYGMAFTPQLLAGGSIKFNMQELGTQQNMSVALDLGGQWRTGGSWQLGLAVKNIGLGVQGYGLPMQVVPGAAYDVKLASKQQLRLAIDVGCPILALDQSLVHAGMEYSLNNLFFIRAGYQMALNNDLDGLAGLTTGLGLMAGGWQLGYTFAPQGDLGTSHRLSLGIDVVELAKNQRAAKKSKKVSKRKKILPSFSTRNNMTVKHAGHEPIKLGSRAGTSSSVSQEEAMMRSLISKNLQVETAINTVNRKNERQKQFLFRVKRTTGPKVVAWTLSLRDSKDKLIKKMSGEGMPRTIIWDGQDRKEKAITEQTVIYKLTLVDINDAKEHVDGRIVIGVGQEGRLPAQIKQKKGTPLRFELDPILFERKRAEITPQGAKIITKAVNYIRQYPQAKVYIQGYADGVEEKSNALILSKKRAEAVARYLTAYHKVPMHRILVRGRGIKNPAVSNESKNQRYQNRRVMITIRGR